MVGRIERNYLIDFCATYICEQGKSLEGIDMEAIIEGRITEYDARGFKLGLYYAKPVTKQTHKRLVNAIKKEVQQRRKYESQILASRIRTGHQISPNPYFRFRTDMVSGKETK